MAPIAWTNVVLIPAGSPLAGTRATARHLSHALPAV
jgi:hypothetical protein